MTKEDKLKYIDELTKTVKGWGGFYRPTVENFIREAKVKIEKIDGKESLFIEEIDVLSKGSNNWVIEYKDELLTTLKLLRFKIETDGLPENNKLKLSEYTIQHLAKIICGDYNYMPYIKGYELVSFFNKYGFNEVYGNGFPSRWMYAEDKIRFLNGKDEMRLIIEEIVDPRRFYGLEINVETAVEEINKVLKYDKYELKKVGDFYKISLPEGSLIQAETTKSINHEFINEQIEKCKKKIREEDYNGAITNSRSLIEAIFIEIIERHEKSEVKNDGNIENLWSKVKKIMKLEIEKDTLPDYVVQILSGIDTAVKGLAGLSNNAGDRHANKFRTRKHHAKLAVNLAMTLSDFLVDSWEYQKSNLKG
jgi:hypothetical protein